MRSLDTSIGLMMLMPPWMKVLSPQLTTCRPRRTEPVLLADRRSCGTRRRRGSVKRVADLLLGQLGQVVAVGVLEIVEIRRAEEAAPGVVVVDAELRRDLEGVGEQVAFVVVEVAVVAVDREAALRACAVAAFGRVKVVGLNAGLADQVVGSGRPAQRHAVADGGVESARPSVAASRIRWRAPARRRSRQTASAMAAPSARRRKPGRARRSEQDAACSWGVLSNPRPYCVLMTEVLVTCTAVPTDTFMLAI